MAYFTEKAREERLADRGITILTEYKDGDAVRQRRSDHSTEDDVASGVILDKQYFRGGKRVLQETEFNPGIRYTYQFPRLKDGRLSCPNCGAAAEDVRFRSGCPYCGSFYNLEYDRKDLGTQAHTNYAVKDKPPIGLALLCFLPSAAVCMLLFYLLGRTHTVFDLLKGLLLGLIIGGLLFLILLHRRNANAITQEGLAKKQRQDQLLPRFIGDLERLGFSLSEFVNLLNGELTRYLLSASEDQGPAVIDFDVLDYREQTVDLKKRELDLLLDLRLIYDDGNALSSREGEWRARLQCREVHNAVIRPGTNVLSCPNCGASVDLTAERCPNCGTETAWQSPLVLVNLEKQ